MRVPRTLREYKDPRRVASAVPWLVLAIFTVATAQWWGAAALAGSLILGVLILLWAECLELEDGEEATAELEQQLFETEARVLDLESANEDLTAQQAAPILTVPSLLHALVDQGDKVERARKHRELAAGIGTGEWPVMSIQLEGETVVVKAYIGDDSTRIVGEIVLLAHANSGAPVVIGIVEPDAPRTVRITAELKEIGSPVDELIASGEVVPQDYSVQLVGLAFEPLRSLSDRDLVSIGEGLKTAEESISASMRPAPRMLSPGEEGQA